MMRSLTLRTLLPAALALAACGGDSRLSARDNATSKACDYYARCEGFSTSATYASRDNCIVKVQATFETWWPPAECDTRIDQAALDLCYNAIDTAACGSGGDFLHALDKCARGNVCPAPSSK